MPVFGIYVLVIFQCIYVVKLFTLPRASACALQAQCPLKLAMIIVKIIVISTYDPSIVKIIEDAIPKSTKRQTSWTIAIL